MIDLSWITDTFAIGGSFRPDHTAQLVSDHGVSAVVDLRVDDVDDARLLARHGVEFLHLPMTDFAPIAPALLDQGVAFVAARVSAGRRVLVHCSKGIGRSAVLGLCVLVEGGLAPIEALALAKNRRRCLLPSVAQYEAWRAWLATRRECGVVWNLPTLDEFRAIAYRHLAYSHVQ